MIWPVRYTTYSVESDSQNIQHSIEHDNNSSDDCVWYVFSPEVEHGTQRRDFEGNEECFIEAIRALVTSCVAILSSYKKFQPREQGYNN